MKGTEEGKKGTIALLEQRLSRPPGETAWMSVDNRSGRQKKP